MMLLDDDREESGERREPLGCGLPEEVFTRAGDPGLLEWPEGPSPEGLLADTGLWVDVLFDLPVWPAARVLVGGIAEDCGP